MCDISFSFRSRRLGFLCMCVCLEAVGGFVGEEQEMLSDSHEMCFIQSEMC